jgi:hypothetical protein
MTQFVCPLQSEGWHNFISLLDSVLCSLMSNCLPHFLPSFCHQHAHRLSLCYHIRHCIELPLSWRHFTHTVHYVFSPGYPRCCLVLLYRCPGAFLHGPAECTLPPPVSRCFTCLVWCLILLKHIYENLTVSLHVWNTTILFLPLIGDLAASRILGWKSFPSQLWRTNTTVQLLRRESPSWVSLSFFLI